jgi:hypothetical protein
MFGTVPEHGVRGFAFLGVRVKEGTSKMNTGHHFAHDLHPECGQSLSGHCAIYGSWCSGRGSHPG